MIGALAIGVPLAGAVVGFTYATVAPTCALWGPVISRGPTDGSRVALTFDDGPTPGTTDRVLDVLKQKQVSATFFVIGMNAVQHPDLLRRIHAEGHLVANHSYHHSHVAVFGRRRYWDNEIKATDDAIESILGIRPAIFRPPIGIKTWHTSIACGKYGYKMVTWSRRAIDGFPTTANRILRRFSSVSAGEILLLHDGVEPNAPHSDRSATIDAIGPLIDSLTKRGLTPFRLDEMLNIPAYRV